MIASKGELERELGFSINTIRASLDLELEREFKMIKKIPDHPDHAKNRIFLILEPDWNWDLIRELTSSHSKLKRMDLTESLFDDLSIIDGGSED